MSELVLFPPITVDLIRIKVTPEWIDEIRNWCFLHGESRQHSNVLSTYYAEEQPHQVEWIWEVLQQITARPFFVNSWVQIYQTAGFQPPHNHVGQDITTSGCLYLTAGSSTYFTDPYLQKTNFRTCSVGDVMFWDPQLYHFSPPVLDERIVLAFNLR